MEFSGDSSAFVMVSEAVPDVLLDIRYYSAFNFIGDRIDGYEQPVALLTEPAARRLGEAAGELKALGYLLKIFDAYRPQCAVDHFVRWAADPADVRMKPFFYPGLSKDCLFPQHYIAKRSGHSRGSTVDLTLFDMKTQRDADMGGTFDFFGDLSHPDYPGISAPQRENRLLLRRTMERHGFLPIRSEWWHFTLENEPFPDTYFTFPVSAASLRR